MIRIEILFDRQSTKNLKSGTLQALQNEIEQRLKPHYPEIWLRIDQGSAPSVSVTGARNDKDKERILSLLEEIWQDDSCVFRSIRSRIGIEVRSAIRIHSINRELNFFYRFLTRFFAAFHYRGIFPQ